MQVHGRDIETECYRVSHSVDGREVTALVPERLAADTRVLGRPSHQDAYVWMAGRKDRIETAIETLARGGTPKPPYDQITLIPSSG